MASEAFHIDTSGENVLQTGATTLDRIVINTASIGSTATVYDNSSNSGTVIAVIDTTRVGVLEYDVSLSALTVETSGVGPDDLTVVVN